MPPSARLVALPGHNLPEEELSGPLFRAGFTCRTLDFSSPDVQATDGSALLLWVGEDWERGFATIAGWPEAPRVSVVMVGKRSEQTRGLIRRMVRLGGLAVVAFPMPDWFPVPLAEALTRLENPSRRRLAEELEALQAAQAEPVAPEELIELVAQAAKRLLHADLAVSALKPLGGAMAFVRTEDGRVVREPWQDNAERRKAPTGSATLFDERQEIRIIPKVRDSQHLKLGQGPGALEAAILLPVLHYGRALTGPAPTLFVSLNLYWAQPFLPTVSELAALEVLRAIARPAVTLLADQARRSTLHAVANKVFSDAFRIELPGNGTDSSAAWFAQLADLVRVHATWPGIKSLWIRRPQRRAEGESWFAVTPGSSPAPFQEEPLPATENPATIRHPEGWVIRARAKESGPHYGEVVALFETQTAAAQARTEVLGLATDLYITLRLHQRAEDTSTLFRLSVPGRTEEAHRDLLETLRIVKDRLASHGAKVFVMVRDSEGVKMWQIANTDFSGPAEEPPRFLADRGMEDWVVHKGTWLLIPQFSKKPGEELEIGWSGTEEKVLVYARPEKEHWPKHPSPDREETMLFVPLLSEGQTIGALAVWRETPGPYDQGIDPGSLLYFAPHVAMACRRMLQLLKSREELQAITHLTTRLSQCTSIGEAWSVVAEGVRALASARLAILLRFDPQCEDYFLAASAEGASAIPPSVADCLTRFRCPSPADRDPAAAVRAALELRLPDLSWRNLLAPEGSGSVPQLLVALFDMREAYEPLLLPDVLLDHFARSYLQTASGLLDRFPEALASHLIDGFGVPEEAAEITADQVLDRVAETLYRATGAEAVILYQGTEELMTVCSIRPRSEVVVDFEDWPQSMTRRALVERRIMRVLEVDDHGNALDRASLARTEKALGWASVGSWLVCPITHRQRTMGLIKLLTSNTGPFLGSDQEMLTEVVAHRAAAVMYKASSGEYWRDLLRIIGEISGLYGQKFEQALVEKLTAWLRKALQRPCCELVLISNIGPDSVPSLQLASEGGQRRLAALVKLSKATDADAGPREFHHPAHGVIAPLILPVEKRLTGHLFVLDSPSFYPDDLETIEKATQYIAFLIDNEIRREEWRQTMGRFRHTVLGPVQGLTSAANQLLRVAQEVGAPDDRLEKPRRQILLESELIRLWRANHRFYLSRDFVVVRRREHVRPIFERCLDRYLPIAQQRGLALTLEFESLDLVATVEAEALDIALSNLLDNACKYAFFNRSVSFGALSIDRMLRVWVEDIGTPIPEDVSDQIYRFGKLGSIRDSLRSTTGQGVGLSLVMRIVAAHDGVLTHSSVREASISSREEDAQASYRVRFTMDLPWVIT